MKVLVTGAGGLVGSESVSFFANKGFDVIGIDNDKRSYFFGEEASTRKCSDMLKDKFPGYVQYNYDICDNLGMKHIFSKYGQDISLIIHTAAQPSHDWAAREPVTDFSINANGTLNLLEACRAYCPNAVFIFTSTNKVYGDTPNRLPLVELATRWEISSDHRYYDCGIDELMSIDQSTHSLFGVSKTAADLLVQEYGHYFGLKTVCFRGGCITGPNHAGAELHGFLAYLMDCCIKGREYVVYGYKGKQVRDNIHSADLVEMFWHFYRQPRCGAVYNAGGGRFSNCSVLEAIERCQRIVGKLLTYKFSDTPRIGDHIWWISDTGRFKKDYPKWTQLYDVSGILEELYSKR